MAQKWEGHGPRPPHPFLPRILRPMPGPSYLVTIQLKSCLQYLQILKQMRLLLDNCRHRLMNVTDNNLYHKFYFNMHLSRLSWSDLGYGAQPLGSSVHVSIDSVLCPSLVSQSELPQHVQCRYRTRRQMCIMLPCLGNATMSVTNQLNSKLPRNICQYIMIFT